MFSERRGRRSLHPNIQQIDKPEFEDVTIPSVPGNDNHRTVHEVSAGTARLDKLDAVPSLLYSQDGG